ncbi:MAG: cob(I)yrinic acid a,c-diamide adenosyltransferase [Thermoplasmata archaeon]|nr:cob(I)yrinic acid a,c-diamide adenosyltransferase [Thermoplasmata archaeon]
MPTARLYTRTGDTGSTGLVGGARVAKDSTRIAAFGAYDELNAHLGRAAAMLGRSFAPDRATLELLQHEVFLASAELASPRGTPPGQPAIASRHVLGLEAEIDRLSADIEPVRTFVLPRGDGASTELHVARTVARRAERALWELHRKEPQRAELLAWSNRVSDLLFALALAHNRAISFVETPPNYQV